MYLAAKEGKSIAMDTMGRVPRISKQKKALFRFQDECRPK